MTKEETLGLFGCKAFTEGEFIRNYQLAMIKIILEDRDWTRERIDFIDQNDFPGDDFLFKRIIGKYKDMYVMTGHCPSLQALKIELLNSVRGQIESEEVIAVFEEIEKLELDEEEKEVYKSQFSYWSGYLFICRMGNRILDWARDIKSYSPAGLKRYWKMFVPLLMTVRNVSIRYIQLLENVWKTGKNRDTVCSYIGGNRDTVCTYNRDTICPL